MDAYHAAGAAFGPCSKCEKNIEHPVEQTLRIEQKIRRSRISWRAEKLKKTQELDNLEKELARLEALTDQETAINEALKEKVIQKEQQLGDIARIEDQISPFLTVLNSDPEAPVSGKFRKLMEALLIEADYGQTIADYVDTGCRSGEYAPANPVCRGTMTWSVKKMERPLGNFTVWGK